MNSTVATIISAHNAAAAIATAYFHLILLIFLCAFY